MTQVSFEKSDSQNIYFNELEIGDYFHDAEDDLNNFYLKINSVTAVNLATGAIYDFTEEDRIKLIQHIKIIEEE